MENKELESNLRKSGVNVVTLEPSEFENKIVKVFEAIHQCDPNQPSTSSDLTSLNILNKVFSEDFEDSSNMQYPEMHSEDLAYIEDIDENQTLLKSDEEADLLSESEYEPSSSSEGELFGESAEETNANVRKIIVKQRKLKRISNAKVVDDSSDEYFLARIKAHKARSGSEKTNVGCVEDKYDYKQLENGLTMPKDLWERLYKYQKTGVKWLFELHKQAVGGILADEMGLGKTVQIISFLRSLAFSQLENTFYNSDGLGPVIIVCPVTIMHQWISEFRKWFPLCRVFLLHSCGFSGRNLVQFIRQASKIRKDGTVLITSYGMLLKNKKEILKIGWHYVLLDEGHKIRNPGAMITKIVKLFRTPHRLIISGSPLQNSLKELWCLFDFIYPGRLGPLDLFVEKFVIPITQGGYANSSRLQVQTAYKCACILRDAINAYILRRTKEGVKDAIRLPTKKEQILLCDLTPTQRNLYKEYLSSGECKKIIAGTTEPFVGLMILRKICNHPDLVTINIKNSHKFHLQFDASKMEFGSAERSGKMQVLQSMLELWKREKQKVLLFSQTRHMLSILENLIAKKGYRYMRMDGATPIKKRHLLVREFNSNDDIFIFLLTTKVGGLGINLTGANRVVIFDPDWNPSTDLQARERAWRIGQNRSVRIYRLLCSGTIEEKIYHRQIFKMYLSKRILQNPKQGRIFKTSDLFELFTLDDEETIGKHGTETESLFCKEKKYQKSCKNIFDSHNHRIRKDQQKQSGSDHQLEDRCDSNSDSESDMIVNKYLSMEKIQVAGNVESNKFSLELSRKVEINNDRPTDLIEINDLNEIPYLKKRKLCKYDSEKTQDNTSKEDYVLNKLLKVGNVRSMDHENIMQGMLEEQLVADEAEKVAAQASLFLKSTKRTHSTYNSSRRNEGNMEQNSWNKVSGEYDCLQFIDECRTKQKFLDQLDPDASQSISLKDIDIKALGKCDRFSNMAAEIRSFMIKNNGSATTCEIVQRFKIITEVKDSHAFRSILKKICYFNGKKGRWTLKEEYA